MNDAIAISGSDSRSPHPSATSRSLLARVRGNDAEAWDRLVSLYAPLVLHWCRGRDLQGHDIADIFQQVFQSVVSHLGGFRGDRRGDTFRGWLRRITENKIRDHYRKQGREPQGVGGSSANRRLADMPAREPIEVELMHADTAERELFQRALNLIRDEFEERTWQAFWQTAVEGRAGPDVAADLGMTPGAVRVAKSRVLHRLRVELGDIL